MEGPIYHARAPRSERRAKSIVETRKLAKVFRFCEILSNSTTFLESSPLPAL